MAKKVAERGFVEAGIRAPNDAVVPAAHVAVHASVDDVAAGGN